MLNVLFVLGECVASIAAAAIGVDARQMRAWFGEASTAPPTRAAAFARLVRTGLMCAVIIAPSVAFQAHGYRMFCTRVARSAEWCDDLLPSVYAHVQRTHWNVGLFRYYELKQLPNFALAAPALALAFGALSESRARGLLLGHYAHLGVVAATGLLIANVQVSTRLLAAACPAWYWHITTLLRQDAQRPRLLAYLCGFNILGTALHANFLPWT